MDNLPISLNSKIRNFFFEKASASSYGNHYAYPAVNLAEQTDSIPIKED
jgi:hypothetical protein